LLLCVTAAETRRRCTQNKKLWDIYYIINKVTDDFRLNIKNCSLKHISEVPQKFLSKI